MEKVGLGVTDSNVGIHLPNPIAIQNVDTQKVQNKNWMFIVMLRVWE